MMFSNFFGLLRISELYYSYSLSFGEEARKALEFLNGTVLSKPQNSYMIVYDDLLGRFFQNVFFSNSFFRNVLRRQNATRTASEAQLKSKHGSK